MIFQKYVQKIVCASWRLRISFVKIAVEGNDYMYSYLSK
jgi:hypothetical protein